ncbi:MAG: hypothetical protein ACRDR6_02550 [Pseudonocardiaceae bacterium]
MATPPFIMYRLTQKNDNPFGLFTLTMAEHDITSTDEISVSLRAKLDIGEAGPTLVARIGPAGTEHGRAVRQRAGPAQWRPQPDPTPASTPEHRGHANNPDPSTMATPTNRANTTRGPHTRSAPSAAGNQRYVVILSGGQQAGTDHEH